MNFNNFRDNYQAGFSGIEGEEEETYIFFLQGEVDIEHYSEDEAREKLLDMTVRELIKLGLNLD